MTVPAGATYRRSFVSPALKPASLKKPQVQSNGSLLWPTIPMPLYQAKNSTRKFKVWMLMDGVGGTGAASVGLNAHRRIQYTCMHRWFSR